MKALILAAGEGRRLRPLTLTCPKPMLPIGDRPLLEHNILLLRSYGIREIAVNLHYLPQVITNYFGNGEKWEVSLLYSFEETLLGSAGAVKKLETFFDDDTFIIIYGDLFTFIDLGQMIAYHHTRGAQATIAVHEVSNPCEKGIVSLDEQGRITRFLEKPKPDQVFSNLASAGVYVIEPAVLKWIPPQTICDFGQHIFPWLVKNNKQIAGYPINELLIDISSWSGYEQAQRWAIPAEIIKK